MRGRVAESRGSVSNVSGGWAVRLFLRWFIAMVVTLPSFGFWVPRDVHRLIDEGAVGRSRPGVAAIGDDYLIAWSAGDDADAVIRWKSFRYGNGRMHPLPEEGALPCRGNPAVAAGEDRFAIACSDPFLEEVVLVQFVGLDGSVIGDPVRLAGGAWEIDIAANDGAWTVVWRLSSRLVIARLSSDGEVLLEPRNLVDPLPAPENTSDAQVHPKLIAVGDDLLLLWQEGDAFFRCYITCPLPPRPGLIRGRYIVDGELTAEPELLIEDPVAAVLPEVAWTGDGLIVSWFTQQAKNWSIADLHVGRFGTDLVRASEVTKSEAGWIESYVPTPYASLVTRGSEVQIVWERPQPRPDGIVEWYVRDLVLATVADEAIEIEPVELVASPWDDSSPRLMTLDSSTLLLVHVERRFEPSESDVWLRVLNRGSAERRPGVRRR